MSSGGGHVCFSVRVDMCLLHTTPLPSSSPYIPSARHCFPTPPSLPPRLTVDSGPFQLRDPANEEKWSFQLAESLARVRELAPKRLMSGRRFLITPSTKPDYEDLKEIIEASGGVRTTSTPTTTP